jgi:glycosidase
MQGHGWTDHITGIQDYKADIEHNMLHFLENHDEQRIASPDFAGSAEKGKPAMVVSATISTSPTMIYFGQEVGEPGVENAGFGSPTRTSIFDYVGVPTHQRWMNNGKFDGGQSTPEEKKLRDFYKRLLSFTVKSEALMGNYAEIHHYNREHLDNYTRKIFSFVRWSDNEKLVIIANFDDLINYDLDLQIPSEIIEKWNLEDGNYQLVDQLYKTEKAALVVANGVGTTSIKLDTLNSFIFKVFE